MNSQDIEPLSGAFYSYLAKAIRIGGVANEANEITMTKHFDFPGQTAPNGSLTFIRNS